MALLAIVGALAGCAQLPGSSAPYSTEAVAMSRQVMIMLPSPARVALRPYDYNGAGYTSGHARARARRIADEIATERGLVVLDDWAMPALEIHCVVARVPDGAEPAVVLDALNHDSRVAWAQPMERYHTLAARPAGPADQHAAGWTDLDSLHRIATGHRVTIAQIDTGVDLRHPVLAGQWSGARNFVDGREFPAELHGTAVASVAVARSDPGTGLVGVAPGARVMPLRACWDAGAEGAACSTFTLAKSLQHALRAAPRVINLSITGPQDRLLGLLIDRALDQGIVVVAAGDESGGPGFPANHPRVLAVYGDIPPASSHSALQAPSSDILTATPNGSFAFLSGTSFAAAQVSGLTALLLEIAPQLTPGQIAAVLQATAMDPGRQRFVARVDPCAALNAVAQRPGLICPAAAAGIARLP
ncbi:MAG: S8 family serine peptidase [Betaproteobacteria bacterium]